MEGRSCFFLKQQPGSRPAARGHQPRAEAIAGRVLRAAGMAGSEERLGWPQAEAVRGHGARPRWEMDPSLPCPVEVATRRMGRCLRTPLPSFIPSAS